MRGDREAGEPPERAPLVRVRSGLVAFGFLLSHGIPEQAGPTKPYWGDGSADACNGSASR